MAALRLLLMGENWIYIAITVVGGRNGGGDDGGDDGGVDLLWNVVFDRFKKNF